MNPEGAFGHGRVRGTLADSALLVVWPTDLVGAGNDLFAAFDLHEPCDEVLLWELHPYVESVDHENEVLRRQAVLVAVEEVVDGCSTEECDLALRRVLAIARRHAPDTFSSWSSSRLVVVDSQLTMMGL